MPTDIEAPTVLHAEGTVPTYADTSLLKAQGRPVLSKNKRPFIRKAADNSQALRHGVQAAFALLNCWIGAQFYLWVRYYESAGRTVYVERPTGVEGWLPIAGMMNLKYFLATRELPRVHPAAMFLFAAFVLSSLLLKKAFCSWLCPIGTFSEMAWKLGRRMFGRNLVFPRWLDVPLRGLKYILLGFFLVVIGEMSAAALGDFMRTPYGLIADVKMLDFFRDMSVTGAIVLGVLVLLSVLVQNFWCRYLCPYGALMGMASFFSPAKVRRDREACIDCGKCARACPAHLPVDRLVQVRSVECAACMECIAACPAQNALQFALPPRRGTGVTQRWRWRVLSPTTVVLVLAALFFGTVGYAKATGHWKTDLPHTLYQELVPNASQVTHPGM
jgi:polyferredoxin